MGIKAMTSFLAEMAPGATRRAHTLQDTGVSRLAVDVSIYMYKFAYMEGMNSATTCLRKFLNFHRKLTTCGIIPVYVFDGYPSSAKTRIVERRAEKRRTSSAHRTTRITGEHYSVLRSEMRSRNIMYVNAHHDAEKACAWLCHREVVDAVASDDFDTLVYGGNVLLRNVNTQEGLTIVRLADVLASLKFTHREFVDMCILSGCDFSAHRNGPHKAFAIVKSRSYDVHDEDLRIARTEFRNVDIPVKSGTELAMFFIASMYLSKTARLLHLNPISSDTF